MTTLAELEKKYDYSFPQLYKTLFEVEMLNWMRGFDLPLEKSKTWAEDVYPTLKENPPLLLHSGGSDFELLRAEEMLQFAFPEEWDTHTHHFIPFAKTEEGNIYAFYTNDTIGGESPVVLIWEDDETEYIAKNFEDFIFRKMMEASDDIDKEDLKADYGDDNAMARYRADLQSDLATIRPYLRENYVELLKKAYSGKVVETLISYGFALDKPLKELFEETIYFDKMGKVFDHEKEN